MPFVPLLTYLGNLDRPMPFRQGAERRPRLDRLQLLEIADQHDLRAGVLRIAQHALHPARTDHPDLVDDKHIAGRQFVKLLPPCVFIAGKRPQTDARPGVQVPGRDARQRRATHRVALPSSASRATPNIALLPVPA